MRTEGEVTLALSRLARLYKDNGLTDSRGPETHKIVTCCRKSDPVKLREMEVLISSGYSALSLMQLCIKQKQIFLCFLFLIYLSFWGCAALRATKAIPKQDLHVNQMDSAWVDYLPGHEIRCK